MPVVSRQNLGSGKVLVTFAESEPMSTYVRSTIPEPVYVSLTSNQSARGINYWKSQVNLVY
jgi:hypothetical protein